MITIHAGHAPDGVLGCGARGNIINESVLNRMVIESMSNYFTMMGCEYKDTTYDKAAHPSVILSELVKCDAKYNSDFGISIHFNSSGGAGAQGTEIYVHDKSKVRLAPIADLSSIIADTLLIPDRGVKSGNRLYYCKKPKQPTMLIEVAFCDAMTTEIMQRLDVAAEEICKWVILNYKTITGKDLEVTGDVDVDVDTNTNTNANTNATTSTIYRVQVGAFKKPENAVRLQQELAQHGYQSFITKDTL